MLPLGVACPYPWGCKPLIPPGALTPRATNKSVTHVSDLGVIHVSGLSVTHVSGLTVTYVSGLGVTHKPLSKEARKAASHKAAC